jgi:predicted HAD superfamily Cof-like phosphohydrolase
MTNKQIYRMVEMVGEFYRAVNDGEYIGTGSYKNKLRKEMREDIFHEELTEFFKAVNMENEKTKRKEQLDAVCDMFYVAAGNLLENSKSIEHAKARWLRGGIWETTTAEKMRKRTEFSIETVFEAFKEVHRSNMTKVCKDGTVLRRADGKIIKPDTFEEPNLEKFL